MEAGSIVALPGLTESFTFPINHDQVIYIGRKAKARSDDKENCLVLPYPEVSAKHAEIRCSNNTWTVLDNGSTNGTTVNGVRINPGKEYVIKDKDVISIANYNLVVSLPNSGADKLSGQNEIDADQGQTQFQVKLINATILVADLKNFSSLMETFGDDPAPVMQAASNVFAILNNEITDQQGQLEKIAGDAIMAYWSANPEPGAVAISCFRACATALKLQEIASDLAGNEKIWPFLEHPLVFDIALASGTVARGALGKAQGNPALLGDTANLAFRLEKLIADNETNKIIVDQNTYELAKENFDFRYMGEFSIKGRHNMANVYQLLGLLH